MGAIAAMTKRNLSYYLSHNPECRKDAKSPCLRKRVGEIHVSAINSVSAAQNLLPMSRSAALEAESIIPDDAVTNLPMPASVLSDMMSMMFGDGSEGVDCGTWYCCT